MRQTSRWMHSFFLISAILIGRAAPATADSCHAIPAHPPSDAEKAFLHADYARAEMLYRSSLASNPNDPALTAGLVRALLRRQRISEASTVLKAALTSFPKSAILLTALGEIDYREGLIVESDKAARDAYDADLCYPRGHVLRARLARLNSMYAIEHREIEIAHSLDPYDPDIRSEWIRTLSLPRRIEELKKYLNDYTGASDEERRRTQSSLGELEKVNAQPQRSCRIASNANSTKIPFEPILGPVDSTLIAAWGLIVKLNEQGAKLEVDTGSSGLHISRAIAKKAGLKAVAHSEFQGTTERGPESGFEASVDSIRVGNLEFRDCLVTVSDRKSVAQSDGVIGMDIFADFLVSLDYPLHEMELSPLPPRPDEQMAPLSLRTGASIQDAASGEDAETAVPENSKPVDGETASPRPAASGPKDRYIAPEMASWSPTFRVGHELILPTTVNKKTTKLFIIDTSAQFTGVSRDAASEVTHVRLRHSPFRLGRAGRNIIYTDTITLQFAEKIQEMDDVTLLDLSKLSKDTGMEITGFIGSSALKFLTLHIDYRDGLVKVDFDPRRGLKQR
jgi:tetratricopeptide (TPR) repeat protein